MVGATPKTGIPTSFDSAPTAHGHAKLTDTRKTIDGAIILSLN
jgi:hypothetical protein